MRLGVRGTLALAAAIVGVGCQGPRLGDGPAGGVGAEQVAAEAVTVPDFLPQGWSPAEREAFWFTSQGSQILSYDIFKALEQAADEAPFRSAANVRRFGYIPWPETPRNPDGMPIGFVRNQDGDRAWMGLTCAACHTNLMSYQGHDILVDGGPTLADFSGFMAALVEAMRAHGDGAKFDRLASRIGTEPKEALRERLRRETAALEERQKRNHSSTAYGHARLDAFGQIFNEVTVTALGIEANRHEPNAPVSYPFLWSTPHADLVQWPGLAENTPPVGALTRNVGEALGVFAALEIKPGLPREAYPSSARLPELAKMENQLKRLWRPAWSDAGLPPVRADLAARGGEIYGNACGDCHELVADPTDRNRKLKVEMTPLAQIGTDPRMVTNALRENQLTGVIEGRQERIIMGARLADKAKSVDILTNAVAGTLVTDLRHTIEAIIIDKCDLTGVELEAAPPEDSASAPASRLDALLQRASDRNRSKLERARVCRQAIRAGLGMRIDDELRRRMATEANGATQGGDAGLIPKYKARSLDGIWATAPYLHNGSVPTLADLLEPPAERPKTFRVGSREFDPVRVGFRSDEASGGAFLLDTGIEGNRNAGHEYGTTLSDADKEALLEYLKTL